MDAFNWTVYVYLEIIFESGGVVDIKLNFYGYFDFQQRAHVWHIADLSPPGGKSAMY